MTYGAPEAICKKGTLYYEVKILGMKPQFRSIGIGFCAADQKRDKPLGNKRGSYSFMGNGHIFTNVKDPSQPDAGEEFSQCGFEEGDVIGCGLLTERREIFDSRGLATLRQAEAFQESSVFDACPFDG